MGSSLIYWAEIETSRQKDGRSLGLRENGLNIHWMGKKGLTIKELDNFIDLKLQCLPRPDFIVIHCGANDLTHSKTGLQLVDNIKCSLLRYNALIHNTTLVWSSMLQRQY